MQSAPPRAHGFDPEHPSIFEKSFQGGPRKHPLARTRVRMNERISLEAVSISQAVGRLNLSDCSGLVVANRGLTEWRGRCFHECDQMMKRVVVEVPKGVPGLCEQAYPLSNLVPTSCCRSDAF